MALKSAFASVTRASESFLKSSLVTRKYEDSRKNARQALKVAHWAYLLETGRIVESGPAAEVGSKQSVQDVFLGGHA